MSELERFLTGYQADHLRKIARAVQPFSECYADHLRAVAQELDLVVAELRALSAETPEQEGEG